MKVNARVLLLCFSAIFFLGSGTYKASHFSGDFIPVYAGTLCLVHGCNPYNHPQLEQQYLAAGGYTKLMSDSFWKGHPSVYPPSTFLALAPFALFRVRTASVLWALLSGISLIVASAFMISVASERISWASTLLVSGILLADYSMLGTANPATFACALVIIGAMFFLLDRHIPLGTVLLTLSLVIKPQIAGVVIVYLVVRGIHRRWSALSLCAGVIFLLAASLMLQMRPGSRNWMTSLETNIADSVQLGHVNDPSPQNKNMGLVNLQTLTSVFLVNPRTANLATQGITLLLFIFWLMEVRKLEPGSLNHFFALPPLLVLALFPVYHRLYDAFVLFLSIPMIEAVIRKHKVLGSALVLITTLPFCLGLILPSLHFIVGHFWNLQEALSHKVVFILLLRPWILDLLLLFGLQLAALRTVSSAQSTEVEAVLLQVKHN